MVEIPAALLDRPAPPAGSPPGLTGWAQVNGRNALSWEDKFALDVWYVEHRGFWLDLQVLFRTVSQVVLRRGISAPGDATMPRRFRPAPTSEDPVAVKSSYHATAGPFSV